jgi:hypothetical protein
MISGQLKAPMTRSKQEKRTVGDNFNRLLLTQEKRGYQPCLVDEKLCADATRNTCFGFSNRILNNCSYNVAEGTCRTRLLAGSI